MAQNDIRVRLTPEGMAEVVRALRLVQKEATTANQKTGLFLREIKSLLPTIGFTAIVTGFAAMVRGAANFADEVGKAGIRTGSSAENFSVLAFAAKTADVEFRDLEQTLARFARNLEGLRAGTAAAEATRAFRELGLTVADFAGLDTAQAFALLSERLTDVEDGTKQSALAMDLLGRSGARALTLVRDLGEKGFREVAKDAEAAGAIISTDLALASAAANDSLTSMGIVVQGLALQFVSGLAPSVNTAMTEFRDDVQGKGTQPVKEFGETAGRVLRVIVAGFTLLGSAAGSALTIVGRFFGAAAAAARAAISGNFTGAADVFRQFGEDARDELSSAFEAVDRNLDKLRKAATEDPIKIKVAPEVDRRALDEASQDFDQQIQKRLKDLQKEAGTEEVKQLQDIAKQRRKLADEAIGLELERARAVQQVQGETQASISRLTAIEQAALTSRTQAVRDAYAAELQLINAREQSLAAAARKQFGTGRAAEQLQTAIAREATQQRLDLATKHYADLAKLQSENIKRYSDAQARIRQIDQETATLRQRHEQIFLNAAKSRQTEEERAAEAQRQGFERIAQLRAAVLAGDLAKAKLLQDELTGVVQTLAEVDGFEGVARQISEDALALDRLLAGVQKGALQKSAKEAESATKSLDKQLEEALAQVTRMQAALAEGMAVKFDADDESMRELVAEVQRKLDEKPFQIRVAPQFQGGGQVQGFASGGAIPGVAPHPRADNVLARLTPGEFVHQVAAVRHYGLDFMRDVNALRFPRFADGGLVGGIESANDGGGGSDEVTITLKSGRQSARVRSSRQEAEHMVEILREVGRGL